MEYSVATRTTREEQRVSVTVEIVGGDIIPWGYRVARLWQPNRARVMFERQRCNGGAWGEWTMLSSRVEGRNIRKDGSGGADRSVRLYGRPRGLHDDAALAPLWDFLAAQRPGAVLPDHYLPGEDRPADLTRSLVHATDDPPPPR